MDLAPQYASILMGVSKTFATMPGFIITPPSLVTLFKIKYNFSYHIISQHEIRFKYINLYFQVGVRVVMTDFYITSGVYMFGVVLNAVFVSGELQPWAPLAPAITDEPLQDKE